MTLIIDKSSCLKNTHGNKTKLNKQTKNSRGEMFLSPHRVMAPLPLEQKLRVMHSWVNQVYECRFPLSSPFLSLWIRQLWAQDMGPGERGERVTWALQLKQRRPQALGRKKTPYWTNPHDTLDTLLCFFYWGRWGKFLKEPWFWNLNLQL